MCQTLWSQQSWNVQSRSPVSGSQLHLQISYCCPYALDVLPCLLRNSDDLFKEKRSTSRMMKAEEILPQL
jgi:hypothetical protein